MGYDFEQDWPGASASADLRARFPVLGPAAADGAEGEPGVAAPIPLRQPDWRALRARFAAIHALRQVIAAEGVAIPPAGSFASVGEAVLSSCRPLASVNPVYSANSKRPCAITGSVAVPPLAATEE
ncbi:hypothetical protein ACFOON_04440 [Novosphingobium piscinae]